MKPPLETVRISQRGKEILTRLKSKTGIDQWNILCRWAFCVSLQTKAPPPAIVDSRDSNLEMSWKTFTGTYSDVYSGVLLCRLKQDGIDTSSHAAVSEAFRCHLERGISKLQAIRSLEGLSMWVVE